MGRSGFIIGLLGIAATLFALYAADQNNSRIEPDEFVELHHVDFGELSPACAAATPTNEDCNETFSTVEGRILFKNLGDAPAKNVRIYARVVGTDCVDANSGDGPELTEMGRSDHLDPGEKAMAQLNLPYSDALRPTATVEVCVIQDGHLPFETYYTRYSQTIGFDPTLPVDNKREIPEISSPVMDRGEIEEGRSFLGSTVCTQMSAVTSICKPSTVVRLGWHNKNGIRSK